MYVSWSVVPMCRSSRSLPENAEMATGTSCTGSARFRAVTTISSSATTVSGRGRVSCGSVVARRALHAAARPETPEAERAGAVEKDAAAINSAAAGDLPEMREFIAIAH